MPGTQSAGRACPAGAARLGLCAAIAVAAILAAPGVAAAEASTVLVARVDGPPVEILRLVDTLNNGLDGGKASRPTVDAEPARTSA